MLLYRAVLCPQWGPRNAAVRAARYYSVLYRAMLILKMLVCRYVYASHIHSAYCTYTYMYRRTCANARVVSHVYSARTAFHTFTGTEHYNSA